MAKSIFNANDNAELIARIEKRSPESQALWGKMNVSQMLSHCQAPMAVARGEALLKRNLFGMLLGWFFKGKLLAPKPWAKGMMTDSTFIRTEQSLDFETEKGKLKAMVSRFMRLGPAGLTSEPHLFLENLPFRNGMPCRFGILSITFLSLGFDFPPRKISNQNLQKRQVKLLLQPNFQNRRQWTR